MPAAARAQRSGQLTADRQTAERWQATDRGTQVQAEGRRDSSELATPHLSAFVLYIFQVLNYNLPLLSVVVVIVAAAVSVYWFYCHCWCCCYCHWWCDASQQGKHEVKPSPETQCALNKQTDRQTHTDIVEGRTDRETDRQIRYCVVAVWDCVRDWSIGWPWL